MKTKRRFVRTVFHTPAVPGASAGSGPGAKGWLGHSRAWCVAESDPDKPEEPRKEGGRAPQETGSRTKGAASARWTQGGAGRRAGGGAQTDQRHAHGKGDVQKLKTFIRPHPFRHSALSVLNE